MFELFNIRVMLVLWEGEIKTTEGRIDDCWRKVFDEGGKTMGIKDGENAVGKRIKSKAKRGNGGFSGQKTLGLGETMEETD